MPMHQLICLDRQCWKKVYNIVIKLVSCLHNVFFPSQCSSLFLNDQERKLKQHFFQILVLFLAGLAFVAVEKAAAQGHPTPPQHGVKPQEPVKPTQKPAQEPAQKPARKPFVLPPPITPARGKSQPTLKTTKKPAPTESRPQCYKSFYGRKLRLFIIS
jgi:hypothetical protein